MEEPHVLAIFHEALAKSVPVTAGAVPGKTVVILNTRKTPSEARDFLSSRAGRSAGSTRWRSPWRPAPG